jgi:hypothetical protein
MKGISFCIPFAFGGIKYLEFLIDNLIKTAKHPERIKIIVSYHDNDSQRSIKNSAVFKKISALIEVPEIKESSVNFAGSANHTKSLNALAKNTTEEIIIFSDYDMAFCLPHWDSELENILYGLNYDLCGVEYQNLIYNINSQPFPPFPSVPLMKYQHIPNLSFFCIKKIILQEKFNEHLSDFDNFLLGGSLPVRLIDSPAASKINNLPIGTYQWLDSGWEIPELIYKHNLRFINFNFVNNTEQTVLMKDPTSHLLFRSEVFYLKLRPFLCHFKKGTSKLNASSENFINFTQDVNSFITKNYSQS